MREKPNIPDIEIQAVLQSEYGLANTAIEFLPLGLDTRAGVYRIASDDGAAYLLKVTQRLPLYAASLQAPRTLHDHGIDAIVAPIRTLSNTLQVAIAGWAAMLYPFIEGISGWDVRLNDAQWRNLGETLNRIQALDLPQNELGPIKQEIFNPGSYSDWIQVFESTELNNEHGTSNERTLRALWREHQSEIDRGMRLMEQLGVYLQRQTIDHVICHADLHPGNMIRTTGDKVFIVDWDEVMLAPKERDFLFIKGVHEPDRNSYPFFQGYGHVEIDWVALTYFIWERVITDLIVCAQDTFRADLEEATKAEAIDLFAIIMSDEGEVTTARKAEARLPGSLDPLA